MLLVRHAQVACCVVVLFLNRCRKYYERPAAERENDVSNVD